MGNALFIVWRESAEAMLVVGILYAWLRKTSRRGDGMRYLWGGVAAGIGLAIALALVMLGIASTLTGNGLDYFQLAMMLVASGLIVQMVFWMRRHGRTFKRDLETDMARNAGAANWWGLLVVVALAVGRETAETVVFLYGAGRQAKARIANLPLRACCSDSAAAFATFWAAAAGLARPVVAHVLPRERSAVAAAGGRAAGVGGREADRARRAAAADRSGLGYLGAARRFGPRSADSSPSFTGYRARPALSPLIALAVYWALVWILPQAVRRPVSRAVGCCIHTSDTLPRVERN